MKYVRPGVSLLFLFFIFIVSCQKEKSFEVNKVPARGSLYSNIDGECAPKNVQGIYIAGTALDTDSYIEVEIEVATTGVYNIVTDTINGYSFKGTGTFAATGTNVIRLSGNGTPLASGTNNFLISFDSSFCYVPVAVLPEGTGEASFTLEGSGGDCINAVVSGAYAAGTSLTLSNTVDIQVNVTQIGTYSITTTAANGISFSGSGVITSTASPQTITLSGSGTPVTEGTTVISVTAGASSCTFDVVIGEQSLYEYFPRTPNSNWSYEYDDNDNDSVLRVSIPETVDISGNNYNVFIQTYDAAAGFDSSGYYRRSGGDYYEYLNFSAIIDLGTPVWMEYIFLKDNSPTGTIWASSPVSGNIPGIGQVTLRMRMAILEKDVDVMVNGTTYPNTIVVEQRFEQSISGNWTDLTPLIDIYIKNYYSRNIGLIKQDVLHANGSIQQKMELRRQEVY